MSSNQTKRYLFYTAGVLYDRGTLQSRIVQQKFNNLMGVSIYPSTSDSKQGSLVLLSSDNVTKFKILIHVDGTLVTEQTDEPFINIVLQSKSKVRYEIKVDQDGSLITKATNAVLTDKNKLILTTTAFKNYWLLVDDDGSLITEIIN